MQTFDANDYQEGSVFNGRITLDNRAIAFGICKEVGLRYILKMTQQQQDDLFNYVFDILEEYTEKCFRTKGKRSGISYNRTLEIVNRGYFSKIDIPVVTTQDHKSTIIKWRQKDLVLERKQAITYYTVEQFLKLVNARITSIYKDVTLHNGIEHLSEYMLACVSTIRDYWVWYGKDVCWKDGQMILESPQAYSTMDTVLSESLPIMLGLLSSDFSDVLESLTWVNHLCHCAGQWNGINLHNAAHGNADLTGIMILDHGKQYGITYELINEISQNSIVEVFPEVLNYI